MKRNGTKRLTSVLVLSIFIVLGLVLGLEQSTATAATNKKVMETKGTVSVQPDYLIGPEDSLEISVWKNEELSKVVTVRPDGMISLPLIGDVKASGYTPNQLRDKIVDRLKEYQETVVASVIVTAVNSYSVYVIGEVSKPGTYSLKRRTTLLQAIAMAGGFNQFASKNKIVVIREKNYYNDKDEKIDIRFDDIIASGKNTDKNIILRPGDTIFVP